MLAVFVNCGAIILGSIIGLLFSKKITGELSSIVQTGAGVVTIVMGIQMAFEYQNIIFLAVSLIAGGILGTLLDIDGKIFRMGEALGRFTLRKQRTVIEEINVATRVKSGSNADEQNSTNFAYGFLNASVLFCVGAMAILGSMKAGIDKDYTIIFTKSVLDGFMAIVFTAAMGIGTAFSAISVFIYQGALTLLATLVAPYADEVLIAELTASGGALIVMIGINLIGIKEIKTANYLPGVVLSVIFVLIQRVFIS